jgi:glycosyltransferase involved in cell wall biosynthesis
MKTKKPSAIIYGYHKEGEEILISDVYFQEGLEDEVVIYSLPYTDAVVEDYSKYKPDLIISVNQEINVPHEYLRNKHIHIGEVLPDNVLANIIVCQTVFRSCKVNRPRFSIFTPIYKTGERILRTYEGLKNQTLDNWEWVIVDDSPNGEIETWNILVDIAEKDYRVKLHDILPKSGGNIGLAKHRAAILCDGDWLIELDHDDCLTNECLMTCNDAIQKYPDAKFLYTNCAEMYDDGEPKYYDHDWSGDWYAREDNYFDFGYAGHTWVDVDGVKRLAHHYPDINPLTIRYNISMPNHARMWERNFYHEIGGHNKLTPVADDLEIIMRTFLNTRMIHVKKVLYLQYNNKNSTVDNNSNDINRRARLIRDYYDTVIHNRIEELGFHDWNWSEEDGHSQKFQNRCPIRKYYDEEQVMNYIYE